MTLKLIQSAFLPLPPLAEQEYIVARVDGLMRQRDKWEARLQQAQNDAEKLPEATTAAIVGIA